MTARRSWVLALGGGLAAAAFAWWSFGLITEPTDFEFWWRAARLLGAGSDPYAMRPHTPGWPLPDRFFYPGPALLFAWPFARLSLPVAFTAWAGVAVAALTFGLARHGRALAPVLLSVPCLAAIRFGQWSPWLAAAVLLPALGAVLAAKPTLGAALFGARPSWAAAAGGALVLLVSLVVVPTWPRGWLENVGHVVAHPAPVATLPGAVVGLALLRWRQPEAQLLLLYACVPQLPLWADQLPVLLVARRRVEALALWGASWIGLLLWVAPLSEWDTASAAPYALVSTYWPALAVVLLRPNAGPAPAWLERALIRWRVPAWLRGSAQEPSAAPGVPAPRARLAGGVVDT